MPALELNEDILKQVFALSSSSTDYEASLAYDSTSNDYWKNENLEDTHKSVQPKREFALDSLRGVLGWLSRNGYEIYQDGSPVDISNVLNALIQPSEEDQEA